MTIKPILACFSLFIDRWTTVLWASLRAIGVTHIRLSINFADLCPSPDPSTWRWTELLACLGAIRAAGLGVYLDTGGAPAWASGGFPTYIGLIPGCAWWNDPQHGNPAEIHFFDQDCATNPKWCAVDKIEAPRPWLTAAAMPKIDQQFLTTIGAELGSRCGPLVDLWGFWNEPGGAMFYPPIYWDDANAGGLGDVIADWFMPFVVQLLFAGLFSVLPNAVTIGIDADGDGVMQRCLAIESRLGGGRGLYNKLGVHPYGDRIPNMAYATTPAFIAAAGPYLQGRELWCTEIGGSAEQLLAWWDQWAASYAAVCMMPFTELIGASSGEFARRFASVNGPVQGSDVGHRVIGRRR